MVSSVKWVNDIIYAITANIMNKLFDEYNIDYIIHGNDPCLLPDGTDAYALAKKAGRYKQIKRTEGVSTTDIVGTNSALPFSISLSLSKDYLFYSVVYV
jgi:ethanolamine-phosphate cytidylyltransferase